MNARTVAPNAHAPAIVRPDAITALATHLVGAHVPLCYAVEYLPGGSDDLQRAWAITEDALAMAVTVATTRPDCYARALAAVDSRAYRVPTGDTMQILTMLSTAMRAGLLEGVVRDLSRMYERMPHEDRRWMSETLCRAMRSALPILTLDDVLRRQ